MTEEEKKGADQFLKGCNRSDQHVEYMDEHILTIDRYNELYKHSSGSISGDGYCLFLHSDVNKIYVMPDEVTDEIFKEDID